MGLGCGWLGGVALFYFLFGIMVCTSYVLFVCVVVVTGYTAMALVRWVLANGCLVITIVVFVSYYRKEIGNSYYWSCFGTVEKASSSEGNCVDQEGSVSGEGGSVGVDVPFEERSGCQEAEKDLKRGLGKRGKSPEMGREGESDRDSEEELCKMRRRV